jgi:8-oxo-dGTP pyrophosphatase MutT (NUDIX family)
VRAAGGVVARVSDDEIEVLVVHRVKYDDWSWPKGHLEPGEDDRGAAIREVVEETGLGVSCVAELGESTYELPSGETKGVCYWLMALDGSVGQPDGEVDQQRWTSLTAASDLLTHEVDGAVLARAVSALSRPGVREAFTPRSSTDSTPESPHL